MRNTFGKVLGLLLLCLSNNIYAWQGNFVEYEWNWDFKKNPTITTTNESAYYNNSSHSITVYALPKLPEECDNSYYNDNKYVVGTGSFSAGATKINVSIADDKYYSDRYYCVVVRWTTVAGSITHYYHCDKTHKDSFTASVSKSITNACESNFSAGVSATVKGGSGSYTAAWSTTNGTWYQGAQFGGSVYAADFADPTKPKTVTLKVTDNVWGTELTRSTTFNAIRFSLNTFYNIVNGGLNDYGEWRALSVTVGGGTPSTKTFKWYKSTSPTSGYSEMSNGNGYILTINNLTFIVPTNTTFFKQFVSQSSCSNSNEGWTTNGTLDYFMYTVAIKDVSASVGGEKSVQINYGGGVTLSCSSTGGRVDKTYTWYKSSSENGTYTTTGGTGASYSPSGITSTTYYKCLVTDPEHSSGVWSDVVTVTVRPQLVAGSISGATTTYSGNNVDLTVSAASGGNGTYSYQWQESTDNGSTWNNVGTNSTSYTATGSGQTKKYKVVVTGDSQTKSTNIVSVTWRSPVAIGSISGGGGTTYSGNNVSLSVGAASGGNNSSYSYQWQESTDNGSHWTNVGTNSTSYTATGSGQTKKYQVVVTDGDGRTATAEAVSVTWRSPVAIGSISGATTTYSGNNVVLTVGSASGGNNSSYSYQWQESTDNGSNWTNVGTNSTSYTAKGSGQTKKYQVVATDGDGRTATTDVVSVTWRSPVTIGSISGATTTYSDNNVELTVGSASGGNNSSYSYQWLESTNDGSSWKNVGSNSTSYTATGSGQTKKYKVVVTDGDGRTATADVVSVTWRSPVAIGSISGATTTYSGNDVNLTVGAASGGNNTSYSYQWKESTDNGSNWNNVGTNSTSYTATGSGQTKKYKVVATDGDGRTATTEAVSVTWRSPVAIGSISGATTTYSGNNVALTVGAASGGNNSSYSYQWQESTDNGSTWTNVGSNSTSYTASGSGQTKKYKVVATDGDTRTATADVVSVTWREQLSAGSITGGGGTTYSGGSVTLTANPSGGDDSYTYQWQVSDDNSSWSNVASDGTGETYSASSTNSGSSDITKYYRVIVDGDSQSETSGSVSVTYRPQLVAGAITGGGSSSYGSSVTLTAHPSGGTGSDYTYQWKQSSDNSNWSDISEETNSTCTVSGTGTMYYKVEVKGDSQTKTSDEVSVTWRAQLSAGSITGGGGTTYSGGSVTLTANPSGGDDSYTYQWQISEDNSSWSNVASNGTGKTYSASITNSGSSNISNYYRVIVGGDGQSETSGSVSVTWRPQLVTGSISGATTTFSGNSVTLTVSAASGGNNSSYSYQWQESTDDGSTWTNVGTNSTSYTATGSGQTKKYKVVVTDGDSQTATTEAVSVTWRSPVAIGSISGATTTYSGNSVTLTVDVASGGNDSSYSYQWQESTDDGSTWTNVGSNSLSYTATGSGQTKKYKVIVTDGDSQTATTEAASVIWRSPVAIGSISGATTTYSGNSVTLTVGAASGGNNSFYSYQWNESTDDGSTWNIVGTNSTSYTTTGSGQTKKYKVVVTDGDSQTATTEAASVTWRSPLVVGSITGSGVFDSNTDVTLSANPSGGDGNYTYQWQQSADDSEWSNISGENNQTITVNGTDLTKYYRVVIEGDSQTQTSASVSVVWGDALIAGTISGATTTCSGGNIELTVSAATGGNSSYTYQWQVYEDSEWSNISGQNDLKCSISIFNAGSSNIQKQFRVKVTDGVQTAYSESVTATWRPALVAGSITGSGTITYSGSDVTLTANPSGGDGNYTYQWQVSKDNSEWTDIQGATFSELVETGVNEADTSVTMYYRVLVSGDYQNAESEVADVTRRPSLKISNIQPIGSSIVYGGDDVNLTITASGGDGNYIYQWYRKDAESDWMPIGGNSSSFTDNHSNNTDSSINYLYKVVVSGDSQEKTSTELQCSWVASMRIDGLIYTKEKLPNGVKTPIEVIMANGSGVYDYQWQTYANDEWQDIPDNDKPVLTITATTTADYRCIITDSLYPAMSVATEIARINVYPAWIPNETPQNSYILDNDTITIGDTSAISSNITYHYRWEIWSANDSVFVPIDDTTATISVLPSTNTIYRRYDIIGDQEKLTLEIKVNVPLDGGTIAVDGLADFYYAGQQLPLLKSATAASGGGTDGSPNYQWYLKKENSSSFEPIEGATEADYQPSDLMGISSLYRAVIDGDDIMYSNTIDLIIKMPEIVIDNLKERYCKDEKVSIKASGVEDGLYKWFDTRGKQVGSGAEFRMKAISENTTLILKTYTQTEEFLGEKKVELTIVDMNPDFVSDRIIVDAGGAVHFTSIGTGFTQYEWDFGDGADGSTEPNPWHYYNGDGTFTVKLQLTNRDGCVAKIAKANYITVNEATTDINDEGASHISIYPNPATDFIMVKCDDESQVTIISSTGAVMLERTVSPTTRIDMSDFPEGTYTVIVASGNGEVHREKIVKY